MFSWQRRIVRCLANDAPAEQAVGGQREAGVRRKEQEPMRPGDECEGYESKVPHQPQVYHGFGRKTDNQCGLRQAP